MIESKKDLHFPKTYFEADGFCMVYTCWSIEDWRFEVLKKLDEMDKEAERCENRTPDHLLNPTNKDLLYIFKAEAIRECTVKMRGWLEEAK